MRLLKLCSYFLLLFCQSFFLFGDNQTADLSPISSGKKLPFEVKVKLADFELPNGWHSGAFATHEGKWLLLAGRTNGLHGFNNNTNNFPPSQQNLAIYVVDPESGRVWQRNLDDSDSGLTQEQVDLLSVTSPQSYQSGQTLYMTGGYGVITATGQFDTKSALTAIDIPGLMKWVVRGHGLAKKHIRQIFHPIFKVTGGFMAQYGKEPTLLIFCQNFQGFYLDTLSGDYTEEVRRFHILDDGKKLKIQVLKPDPKRPNPNYRRRDLNVVPYMQYCHSCIEPQWVALSGVFTLTNGAWTVPVTISPDGKTHMSNPSRRSTFKQGMNNYICPTVGLFSKITYDMYTVLLGGISYGYFDNGNFETDDELPFINQITTIRTDKNGITKQFLMKEEYPVILSTGSNPGNPLLFGAAAAFIPVRDFPAYENGVLQYEALCHHPTLVGYIVGGIQSTLPNTNTASDSTASAYVFEVYLKHKED